MKDMYMDIEYETRYARIRVRNVSVLCLISISYIEHYI